MQPKPDTTGIEMLREALRRLTKQGFPKDKAEPFFESVLDWAEKVQIPRLDGAINQLKSLLENPP